MFSKIIRFTEYISQSFNKNKSGSKMTMKENLNVNSVSHMYLEIIIVNWIFGMTQNVTLYVDSATDLETKLCINLLFLPSKSIEGPTVKCTALSVIVKLSVS